MKIDEEEYEVNESIIYILIGKKIKSIIKDKYIVGPYSKFFKIFVHEYNKQKEEDNVSDSMK